MLTSPTFACLNQPYSSSMTSLDWARLVGRPPRRRIPPGWTSCVRSVACDPLWRRDSPGFTTSAIAKEARGAICLIANPHHTRPDSAPSARLWRRTDRRRDSACRQFRLGTQPRYPPSWLALCRADHTVRTAAATCDPRIARVRIFEATERLDTCPRSEPRAPLHGRSRAPPFFFLSHLSLLPHGKRATCTPNTSRSTCGIRRVRLRARRAEPRRLPSLLSLTDRIPARASLVAPVVAVPSRGRPPTRRDSARGGCPPTRTLAPAPAPRFASFPRAVPTSHPPRQGSIQSRPRRGQGGRRQAQAHHQSRAQVQG